VGVPSETLVTVSTSVSDAVPYSERMVNPRNAVERPPEAQATQTAKALSSGLCMCVCACVRFLHFKMIRPHIAHLCDCICIWNRNDSRQCFYPHHSKGLHIIGSVRSGCCNSSSTGRTNKQANGVGLLSQSCPAIPSQDIVGRLVWVYASCMQHQ
jgi:hypothetical protein